MGKKKVLKAPRQVHCTRYLLPELQSQTFFFFLDHLCGVCDLIRREAAKGRG